MTSRGTTVSTVVIRGIAAFALVVVAFGCAVGQEPSVEQEPPEESVGQTQQAVALSDSPTRPTNKGALVEGGAVTGDFVKGKTGFHSYTFSAVSGATLRIRVSSTEFRTLLVVRSPSGIETVIPATVTEKGWRSVYEVSAAVSSLAPYEILVTNERNWKYGRPTESGRYSLVAHSNSLGSACTPDDIACPAEAFCDYAGRSCDGSAGPGICTSGSNVRCSSTADPVCGCDGITYVNWCYALVAGVSVASDGGCR